MASAPYVNALLRSLPQDTRLPLGQVFEYVLANLRLGRCAVGHRAENLQMYAIRGVTHATPNTEFSIAHGLGTAPYLALPFLPLDTVNASIVPLTVTKPADGTRVYLSSPIAGANITILVEGA